MVIYSDLSIFSSYWTHLGAPEDSQESMCSVRYNLFSGTNSVGGWNTVSLLWEIPNKNQKFTLQQCSWIWGFTITCRIESSPWWCVVWAVLPLFQLPPSVPKRSSCWWFFLGKGCQITQNCAVMSSKEIRDKTTELFFIWLNQALYLAHREHQGISHPLSSRQVGFAEWNSIVY